MALDSLIFLGGGRRPLMHQLTAEQLTLSSRKISNSYPSRPTSPHTFPQAHNRMNHSLCALALLLDRGPWLWRRLRIRCPNKPNAPPTQRTHTRPWAGRNKNTTKTQPAMFGNLFSRPHEELLDHQSWVNRNKRSRDGACWFRGGLVRPMEITGRPRAGRYAMGPSQTGTGTGVEWRLTHKPTRRRGIDQ